MCAPLEVVEVDRVAAVGADDHLAVIGDGAGEPQVAVEAVVGRGRHEDAVAGRREGVQRRDDAGVHAGGEDEGRGVDFDAVVAVVPGGDCLGVGVGAVRVAPVLVGTAFGEGACDAGGGAEVHVGHAHGGDDAGAELVDRAVPADGVGADAVVDFVEVVGGGGGLGLVGLSVRRGRAWWAAARRASKSAGVPAAPRRTLVPVLRRKVRRVKVRCAPAWMASFGPGAADPRCVSRCLKPRSSRFRVGCGGAGAQGGGRGIPGYVLLIVCFLSKSYNIS